MWCVRTVFIIILYTRLNDGLDQDKPELQLLIDLVL